MTITPQLLIHINDPDRGFLGYLAIDSFLRDKASGGIRVKTTPNVPSQTDAHEVSWLARTMTLKYGFHQIPMGGAKGIVFLPLGLGRPERDLFFKALGRAIGQLLQKDLIHVGQDMGMNERDLYFIGVGANLIHSLDAPSEFKKSDSGRFTAIGIMETFKITRQFYAPSQHAWTCSLEGFGSVGWHLAGYLASEGVKVVAISTLIGGLYNQNGLDIPQLMALQEKYGDKCVDNYKDASKITPDQLFEKKADVLFPCGGFFLINPSNASHIQCPIIIEGSNKAIDEECLDIILQRRIHYIPGFVTNAGSVLKNHVAKQEKITNADKLENRTKELFTQRIKHLLEESSKNNLPVYQQAIHIAQSNIRQMNQQKDNPCSLLNETIKLVKTLLKKSF